LKRREVWARRFVAEDAFGMGGAWVPKKAALPAQSFTFDLEACE
jgi:hypothetical protein